MKGCLYIRYNDAGTNEEIELPLDQIVRMLLAVEMDIIFHIEALKAQAVIIRTNLVRNSHHIIDYNIRPIEAYKDIWGSRYDKNVEKVDKAVKDTEGILILFKEKPIDAKYHVLCGGSTENAEDVMDNQVTYLRRVLCDHCVKGPHWKDEKEFEMGELERLLDIKFPDIDGNYETEILNFIEDIEKDEHGRVRAMRIGDKRFSGPQVLKLLGLNSTKFDIYPTGIRFISNGMGHGLGLCQWGANTMGLKGHGFTDILKYYYTGVDIEKVELPSIKKPLIGKIIMIDPGHGGKDWGHKGIELGTLEKDIVLEASIKLKDSLESLGATVHLTRDEDVYIPINERVNKANSIYPDIFISLHMDYFPRSNMKGLEMFYFKKDMEGRELGEAIFNSLKARDVFLRGLKEGNFYIFRGINVNSLLIELGYLSNGREELRFRDEGYIRSLIDGMEEGILKYLTRSSKKC
ncbi:MAG TPA: N-acetylmuramoyl-L-alanine amidase [Tepidimicrobium sp.]|nr:N-acetylmuramoyl-L-alanine amidase [Tepidimicrobium sp.]